MQEWIIFLFLAVAPLVNGCSDTHDWVGCPDEVIVTVQMADHPVFSWDPACSAVEFEVFVFPPGDFRLQTVWALAKREFVPPVVAPLTYSVKPEDIDQPTPAIPLKKGVRYGVWVTSSTRVGRVVGRTEFIYDP